MKSIIVASLKTKYQRFGLSNEAIDRIASAREKTVTSEEEIATATADVVTMELIASELQKMRDKEIQTLHLNADIPTRSHIFAHP